MYAADFLSVSFFISYTLSTKMTLQILSRYTELLRLSVYGKFAESKVIEVAA